ncbi:MAG: hypothetical protein QS721_05010 [Candidatus Endonucleobacter sp. (ex Gigantidas childressi)]|nr:hypothetical protein [Candidatus Endonucleobacter sp. (ex Gigantidas childressi)]
MGTVLSENKQRTKNDNDLVGENKVADKEEARFSLAPRINRSYFVAWLWVVVFFEVAAQYAPEYIYRALAQGQTIQESMYFQLGFHIAGL